MVQVPNNNKPGELLMTHLNLNKVGRAMDLNI